MRSPAVPTWPRPQEQGHLPVEAKLALGGGRRVRLARAVRPSPSQASGWCSSPSSWRPCSAPGSRWIAPEHPAGTAGRRGRQTHDLRHPRRGARRRCSPSVALDRQHGGVQPAVREHGARRREWRQPARHPAAPGRPSLTQAMLCARVINVLVYPAILLADGRVVAANPARLAAVPRFRRCTTARMPTCRWFLQLVLVLGVFTVTGGCCCWRSWCWRCCG